MTLDVVANLLNGIEEVFQAAAGPEAQQKYLDDVLARFIANDGTDQSEKLDDEVVLQGGPGVLPLNPDDQSQIWGHAYRPRVMLDGLAIDLDLNGRVGFLTKLPAVQRPHDRAVVLLYAEGTMSDAHDASLEELLEFYAAAKVAPAPASS